MRMLSRGLFNVAAIAIGTACWHPVAQRSQPEWHGAQWRALTRVEVEQAGFATAFDAIQVLRPAEFPAAAPSASALVVPGAAVFIDSSSRDVGLVSLRQFAVAGVCRVLFLHGADARLRYGVEHAIVVQTVTGQDCR